MNRSFFSFGLVVFLWLPSISFSQTTPPFTDYCEMLARDIQNKKHGFLAGNLLYYVGGQASADWDIIEHETLGFTHGFFRDGRARGQGRVVDVTGFGHDMWGWEFYRKTKVAYGTVIFGAQQFENPVPTSIIWRPDKMICTYQLSGVTVTEHKFISNEDVLVSIITSSQPVTLEFNGHSFVNTNNIPTFDGDPPNTPFSQQRTATASFDSANNAIHITEGGTIMTKIDFGRPAVEGQLMYHSMSVALSSTADISGTYSLHSDNEGRQVYSFRVPCDQSGVAIAFAMGDDYAETIGRVTDALANPDAALQSKTDLLNDWLNYQIPYFRCSDSLVEQTYYYLWSLYFLYMIDVAKGWELYPHTQTAVNNFLGLHAFDAYAFVPIGSWTVDKAFFAYGNALNWKFLLPFKTDHGAVPDNFGYTWYSPVKIQINGQVEGAWQIYEHSADLVYLNDIYAFYKELYWNHMNLSWGIGVNALNTLIKMANATGNSGDTAHWESMRDAMIPGWENGWDGVNFYGPSAVRDIWNITSLMYWGMPDEWARKMVNNWVMNSQEGYLGQVPINVRAKDSPQIPPFVVSTLSTYLVVEGMYRHHTDSDANFCTLGHIEGMNRDFGFPVTPEAWDQNYAPWGDMYYNWDSAILLLLIERIAGIRYSVIDDEFVVSDHTPKVWDFAEIIVPVVSGENTDWMRVLIEKVALDSGVTKTISVTGNTLGNLHIQPWLEDRELISSDPPNFTANQPPGHVDFDLGSAADAMVTVELSGNQKPTGIFLSDFGVPEMEPAGTAVALLSSKDADDADTHTYHLASGEGDEDNASFNIVQNTLVTAEEFDFETKNVYHIRLRTRDNNGGSYEESFVIRVEDVFEPPDTTVTDTLIESFDGPEFDLGAAPGGFWELVGNGGAFNGQGQYTVFTNENQIGLRGTIGAGSFTAHWEISNIDWIADFAKVNWEFWDDGGNAILFFLEKGDNWMKFIVDMRTNGNNFVRKINLNIATPTSAKLKVQWIEESKEWRVWYGLNGADATTEPAGSPLTDYILPAQPERYILLQAGQWNDGEVSADFDYFEIIRDVPVGIVRETDNHLPAQFDLGQNYPNPFNPSTQIAFSLPTTARVILAIHDILGRKIRTLLNQTVTPGHYQVTWDGRDENGKQVASGLYIYRIRAGNYYKNRKMLLIR